MSRLRTLLTPALPPGMSIPEPLERAWTWMEDQGFVVAHGSGHFVTPYAGTRQLGIVFSPGQHLGGWCEPGEPGHDHLLPIAEIAGDGSQCVLWNDAGTVRFAVLGSDGETFLLADSAVDFLRFVAIGYDEVPYAEYLAGPPEEEEAVEAHAAFRRWVESEFDVEVPAHWRVAEQDAFHAWCAKVLVRG
ncbi:hypothetical protein [Nocardiopsis sp. MG754419]|uniref:hypothetical protein n=1 Tax=Nocardiopsis sp. MG754419 TaxID=2259865 RepID=UPI001BA87BC2|nr:hypothetical protein [Nocardiopsis sp. MG754419]MBR8744977.1 hypothetical protein [Nocardiopsis sp. MG754419]